MKRFTNLFKKKPPASQDTGHGEAPVVAKRFVDLYTYRSWSDIFTDQTPVPLSDPSLGWLQLPDQSFIDYVANRAPLPFDSVPPDPQQFVRPPTFMITQIHRLWITLQTLRTYLRPDSTLLDLGAFPFSLDIILREYAHFEGRIHTTANLPLLESWLVELKKRMIETSYLNLDPLVKSGEGVEELPERIGFGDNSVDLAVFTHVIEHLYHPLMIFKEIYRVLRSGGKLLVSTDNAFMLDTLFHLCYLDDFLHEPIERSAAMAFHFWRGHNRLFSESDLIRMLEHCGFRIVERAFYEVFYNSFSTDYFLHPISSMPAWRANILTQIPAYRNEIVLVAEK